MSGVKTDYSQFQQKLINCGSVDAFYSSFSAVSAAYSIEVGDGIKLDIEVDIKDPRVIVFVFAGAKLNKKIITTPFFMARGIGAHLEATIVYISDPGFYLHEEIKLAWYAGSNLYNAQKEIPPILSFLSDAIGAKRHIFFGGSGGGFASLFYSRLLPNSMALIWNPQINISNYPAGRYSVINLYSKIAFGVDRDELDSYIVNDITKLYKLSNHDNIIVYMQNMSDHHAERDLQPFLSMYNAKLPKHQFSGFIDDNFYLHFTNWSQGHRPPPKVALSYLIERFSRPSLEWSKKVFHKTFQKAEKMSKIN